MMDLNKRALTKHMKKIDSTIQRYPLLAHALGKTTEVHDQSEPKAIDRSQRATHNRNESRHAEANQSDLNELYKNWDPNAYQQWCRLQIQQTDTLDRLLAHTFTRSRPINYDSPMGKVFQWETLLPIIPRAVDYTPEVTTIDLTNDEDSNANVKTGSISVKQPSKLLAVSPKPRVSPTEPRLAAKKTCGISKNSLAIPSKSPQQLSNAILPNPREHLPKTHGNVSKASPTVQVHPTLQLNINQQTLPMTLQTATIPNHLNKQQARDAFRLFVRQNYHLVRRMLGKQYSRENLRNAFSKWWSRMIPAGRGFYVAKVRENDAKTVLKVDLTVDGESSTAE